MPDHPSRSGLKELQLHQLLLSCGTCVIKTVAQVPPSFSQTWHNLWELHPSRLTAVSRELTLECMFYHLIHILHGHSTYVSWQTWPEECLGLLLCTPASGCFDNWKTTTKSIKCFLVHNVLITVAHGLGSEWFLTLMQMSSSFLLSRWICPCRIQDALLPAFQLKSDTCQKR